MKENLIYYNYDKLGPQKSQSIINWRRGDQMQCELISSFFIAPKNNVSEIKKKRLKHTCLE